MNETLPQLKGLRVATEDHRPLLQGIGFKAHKEEQTRRSAKHAPLRGIGFKPHKGETKAFDPHTETSRQ